MCIRDSHKSKGLQFKVVICPYLWQKPPDKKSHLWKDNQNLLISKKYIWHKKYSSYQNFIRKESVPPLPICPFKLLSVIPETYKSPSEPISISDAK